MGALSEKYQSRVDAVIQHIRGVDKKLDQHDKKLDLHTETLGRIMIQLEEVKAEMRQKVDLHQFAKLEKRVAILEAGLRR